MAPHSAQNNLFVGAYQLQIAESVQSLREGYASARPFSHVIFDNLFPEQLLDDLNAEMPGMDRSKWVFENDDSLVRYNMRSVIGLGAAGTALATFFHSANFLYFLTEITGIGELLPDPYLQGAGYNMMPAGGYFQIHSDRNTAYETGLTRRLALILYLNKNWPPEYGGQLELWDNTGSRREMVVQPVFNRMIVFDTGAGHFHGVPPVTCPEERSRNAFLVYFHTVGIEGKSSIGAHGSVYTPRYYATPPRGMRELLKELTPPILYRTFKRIRRKKTLKNGAP